ncbi:MAG TPA: insulinase family protein, partial [Burkholderiales bacterium]|nr:insulinase family protein [Burkholderiales bacterium]
MKRVLNFGIMMMLAAFFVPSQADVLKATLDNGLKVVIVKNDLVPVVTTQINYLAGSNEAPEGFPGMAHAQEHMMFRGSPGLSAGQLADISAEMGGVFDADTQQSVTQYFFTVPAKDLDVALHIEAIRMKGVLDSDSLWGKERGAIEQEVAQDLSNPEYVFYSRLLSEMFRGTPYAHDALGTKASFDRTTGAMLQDYYNKWYAPNNAVLVVVGNVDPAKALSKIKSLFGDIKSRTLPQRPGISLEPVKPQTLHFDTDRPYGMAVLAFRMPGYDSPDYAASQVLSDVLSSERGDLYGLVPEGRALSAGFSLNTFGQTGMGFAAGIFPKGGDPGKLVEEITHVLGNYLKNGFPADLVEAAKRHEVASYEFQKNSVSGLASSWSQAVAVEGRQSPDDDVAAIRKVTAEDVNRVARKYLLFDHAIVAVLTPKISGKPVASKGFGGAESFASKEAKSVALPDWARRDLGKLAIPETSVHPVDTRIPNGIRLIVQPEKVSETVSVYGHIDNHPDLEEPPKKEGVAKVLEKLFSFGTQMHDRIAFQKALDDIAADESAGTDFSLQVLKGDFEKGIGLLAENELHPALPEAAFEVVRRQV